MASELHEGTELVKILLENGAEVDPEPALHINKVLKTFLHVRTNELMKWLTGLATGCRLQGYPFDGNNICVTLGSDIKGTAQCFNTPTQGTLTGKSTRREQETAKMAELHCSQAENSKESVV